MNTKVKRFGGSSAMNVQVCPCCKAEQKCRRRDFSNQVWSMLVSWSEIQKSSVDQPICEDCYQELREVLIDRATEVETQLAKSSRSRSAEQKAS